ncbi:MAG: S1C family serine protease [Candidatus Bathyarchaeota archaeon]|nr:S1C family serine protease [Candidatus Bathyarchaeota archaeon]
MKNVDKKTLALLVVLIIVVAESLMIMTVLLKQTALMESKLDLLQSKIEALEKHENATAHLHRLSSAVVAVKADTPLGIVWGSGFISRGYIVTAYHVIRNASAVTVYFSDYTYKTASVVGYDLYTDLAVLNATLPSTAKNLDFSSGSTVYAGSRVFVISRRDMQYAVGVGYVASKNRNIRLDEAGLANVAYAIADVIEFDAEVNFGASGSPLINEDMDVVGVVFGMNNVNAGLAVSSDIASRVVASLIENGAYEHPWVGIYYTDYVGGLYIADVIENSPAAETGLQPGDVIVAVNQMPVNVPGDFVIYLERYCSPGDMITLTINRGQLTHKMELKLQARP